MRAMTRAVTNRGGARHLFQMRAVLAVSLLAAVACGTATPAPVGGAPLTVPQLKFAVMDSVGRPAYCDPDFYPIARQGGEEANAAAKYPAIKADTVTHAAILAHEHLPSGELSDAERLTVYRAWKLLLAVTLTSSGNDYAFDYRVQAAGGGYQMVAGTVRADGMVSVRARTASGAPRCPICLAASTLIDTPAGSVRVTDVVVGTIVWTQAPDGSRVAAPVVAAGSVQAPEWYQVTHLVLADGRDVLVSPGHQTADGREVGSLRPGDRVDGSSVASADLVAYAGGRTYDLLPAGASGLYWANGIRLRSTLGRRLYYY